jgi:hypothetical protein
MKAPVDFFVYKRPDTLKRTLESLRANSLAPETAPLLFSDGPERSDAPVRVEAIPPRSDERTVKAVSWFFLKTNIAMIFHRLLQKAAKLPRFRNA